MGEAKTCYGILVEVVDETQLAYDDFVEYIVNIFNDFEDYYKKAADVCSYNNIKNEFNQFFIDSVNELYPEKPWIIAAYTAQALSELILKGTVNQLMKVDLNLMY